MALRVLTICGTRPEAIKLAPVVLRFEAADAVVHRTCVTAQHRRLLDQVFNLFAITAHYDLDLMRPSQAIAEVFAAAFGGIGRVIDEFRPDWVIVQGDTTTALAGAMAAQCRQVKVAHVEAGLRTGNLASPWPEESNRRLIATMATLHFAPTMRSAANLLAEGVHDQDVVVTGNTGIDALDIVCGRLDRDEALRQLLDWDFPFLDPARRLILVTGHRRENLDGGLERTCAALRAVAARSDVQIVYPVHPNPAVQEVVQTTLSGCPAIHLIEPLDYLPFVHLMRRAHLIVTDSGGIQEEAPRLGKPTLITRDITERPEAIEAGTARLVGASSERLVGAINELLDNPSAYAAMARIANPFGDGRAAERIVARLTASARTSPLRSAMAEECPAL